MYPPPPLVFKTIRNSSYCHSGQRTIESCEGEESKKDHIGQAYFASLCGLRDAQEDRYDGLDFVSPGLGMINAFTVIDGHGGHETADYCASNLLRTIETFFKEAPDLESAKILTIDAFINVHRGSKAIAGESGACVIVALKINASVLLASAGDCRSLLIYKDGRHKVLSIEHSPTMPEEKSRIEKAGLCVQGGRVINSLAVSRAIGDFEYGGLPDEEPLQAVTCVPSISLLDLDSTMHGIVLMSDGVYDALSMEELSSIALTTKSDDCCESIIRKAFLNGSADNVTAAFMPL